MVHHPFLPASMEVHKRYIYTQRMEIVYWEASWPAAKVAHRIKPLAGCLQSHTKKRPRYDMKNYKDMLKDLMVEIQGYLLLKQDDDDLMKKSMDLVPRFPREPVICVWLKDIMD